MNIKKITFGIIILMTVFFGFNNFVNSADSNALLVSEGRSGGAVGGDLLVLLLELKSLSLDGGIFANEAFINLKDFSTEIRPQPVGRNNPFAAIGNDVDIDMDINTFESGDAEAI
ncbi:hypothetical protein KKG48_01415 [Patescibacteria group bacterium]|nr:hypothetical protein [Patescibacteria group bacterium]MCG2694607.1 hypothetical protein [Candidatus Parcubacteria bacterium]